MPRDITQYAGERADTEGGVAGNGDVVFPALIRRQSQMASGLSC